MTIRMVVGCALIIVTAGPALAADAPSDEYPNEKVGPRVLNVEPNVPPKSGKLLEAQGKWLNDHGVSPHLSMTEIYLRNPSAGLYTGNHESLTIFAIGADFNLDKLIGLPGGTIHFEQLYVPWTSNLDYGRQVGDVIAGKPGPYIPNVSHLSLFTYEQKLLDDKLSIEAGKSNAGNYFALPLCNVPLGCVNAILQDTAGINPPPYANWGARVGYDFSPAVRAQVGAWRSNNAYPFTNGWERGVGESGGTLSTVYLANLAYRTDYRMQAYPQTFEVLGFHNNGQQTDPYFTVNGTSKVTDTTAAADTRKGVTGFYLGAKKTVWRQDGGATQDLNPTAVAAYASLTHTLDEGTTNGVGTQGNAGLILSAPFRSRPFDSYSVNVNWAQLTSREQRFLEEAHAASGGGSYRPGRNEYAVALDANFILTDSIVLSPFVLRTWGASSWLNPYTGVNPRDGYAAGLLLHVQFDEMLGLNSRH
ncbi:carbohydrate porin [Pseudomonas marginalis]|jgi:porin|uniref:carbohydrate porin n=1 Tax=Pseudomonas marginalis TaxID=298 RepID=UPI0011B436D3|nr:carbohydrate porin [Pseudomonas marginalis]KAA8554247.1 Porin B [Pseudomonas marginalis]TWR72820.1 carbohydrate porin [Pseudomonas marginalis]